MRIALDQTYMTHYQSGSFDSGLTFEKVHELIANGYAGNGSITLTQEPSAKSTAGCKPMHRFKT